MSKKRTVNLAHARGKFHRDVMERIVRDNVCPFCEENFLNYHTKPIIKTGRHWILTENFLPYKGTKVHLLAVSRKHVNSITELSPAAHTELFTLFGDESAARKIKGGAICMRFGDTNYTGGSVEHLHAHLISGAKGSKNRKPLTMGIGYMA